MKYIINLINQTIPDSFLYFLGTITTPGHIILFISLLCFIILIKYLFQNFIRNFILLHLYKKRSSMFHRLLFHRFHKLSRPLRYLISFFLFELSIQVFSNNGKIDFIFYILYLFIFAWWFYEIIKFTIYVSLSMRIEKDKEIHQEIFVLFLNITKVLIALVVTFAILARVGVNLTGLVTSLGVGGIVIGLSAKDTLTNFFDSIRLIGENAFHIGDWIETEHIEGVVTQIGLAATYIRTFDNALITVPNSKLAGNYIKNWSKRKVGRRIKFNLRLQYTYDMEELEKVIADIYTMINSHSNIVNEHKIKALIKRKKTYKDGIFNLSNNPHSDIGSKLLVYLDEIDDYSMNILIYTFSISTNWEEWLRAKQDILKEVILIIDKSKLELAIPQEEIHLKKEPL